MLKKPLQYYYRKTHRYLGLIIGVQFFFWTLGGLFFAWSNIDQIHGDFNKKQATYFNAESKLISPQSFIDELKENKALEEVQKLELINILELPYYRIVYKTSKEDSKVALYNANNGALKVPLTKEEAIQMAKAGFTPESPIKSILELKSGDINKHHEYRSGPLPAYRIEFDHESGTRVYVSAEYGQIISFRNSNWRIFDFLWMMHTMDYNGRDNFGNILLRILSISGLITVLSGFLLYYISSPAIIRMKMKKKK